jgi:hypothetical protein
MAQGHPIPMTKEKKKKEKSRKKEEEGIFNSVSFFKFI